MKRTGLDIQALPTKRTGLDAQTLQRIPTALIDAAILHVLEHAKAPLDVEPLGTALGCESKSECHLIQARLGALQVAGKAKLVFGEGWCLTTSRKGRAKTSAPQVPAKALVTLRGGSADGTTLAVPMERAAVSLETFCALYRGVLQNPQAECPAELVMERPFLALDAMLQQAVTTVFDFLPEPHTGSAGVRFMLRMYASAEAPGVPDRWTCAEVTGIDKASPER